MQASVCGAKDGEVGALLSGVALTALEFDLDGAG